MPPSSFHDVGFPVDIAFGASGGPERRTEIITLGSGREFRNSRWADARRRFDAGYGIRTLDDLYDVISFFEERRGRLYGFRFRDKTDWKSCAPGQTPSPADQTIGIGNGSTLNFQLVKSYGLMMPYVRRITRPVAGSVRPSVAGIEVAAAVDLASGTLTFAEPPPPGAVVAAGFAFDLPARFDTDRLVISLSGFEAGEIPSIPVVEIAE